MAGGLRGDLVRVLLGSDNKLIGHPQEARGNFLARCNKFFDVLAGTIEDLAGNGLAAGYSSGQTYGRLPGGTLVAWGDNQFLTIGDQSNINRPVPVAVVAGGVLSGQTMAIPSAGLQSSLVLSREGNLFAWGSGSSGQLGNGANDNSAVPVAVDMLSGLAGQNVISAVTSGYHDLALSRTGVVFSWGGNASGQLGRGDSVSINQPRSVATTGTSLQGIHVVALAAANSHSLALGHDGRVYAWGSNTSGQLGNNSATDSHVPVAVDVSGGLSGKFVVAIGAGSASSAALTSDGKVYCWGTNGANNLGNPNYSGSPVPVPVPVDMSGVLAAKTVAALAVGGNHCLVLTTDGLLFAWGFNASGQLGGGNTNPTSSPVAVDMSGILAGRSIVSIAAGRDSSYALDSSGRVYSWGDNSDGCLGQGTSGGFTTVPGAVVTIGAMADRAVFALGGSSYCHHLLALARDKLGFYQVLPPQSGTYATGASLDIQVGFAESVTTSGSLRLALTVGSRAVFADCVSNNGSGLLAFRYIVQPGDFDGDGVAVGSIDLNGGTLRDRFGYDVLPAIPPQSMAGVLIDATSPVVTHITRFQPQASTSASGSLMFRVSFDRAVTGVDAADFALATTGDVTGGIASVSGNGTEWYAVVTGVGGNGALRLDLAASGTGIVDSRGNPHSVGFTSGQFYLHTTATSLATWGSDSAGQLGLAGPGHSLQMPTAIPAHQALVGRTVAAMATGTAHTLALTSNGQVLAWGDNSHGALGNDSNDNSPVPVAVVSSGALLGATVMAIAAGGGHSLALSSDGRVFGWGLNDAGQLGTGSGEVNVPTAVQSDAALAGKLIIAIAAGGSHSLALASDGSLFGWGDNGVGQLGTGSSSAGSPTPIAVNQTGVLAGKAVIAIAAGANHSLALTADGLVFAWGGNLYGQVGDDSGSNQASPVAVRRSGAFADQTLMAVTAGDVHSLALSASGRLFAWGENFHNQIGDGLGYGVYSFPAAVVMTGALSGKTITAIAAGSRHNLVLSSSGQAFSWGDNQEMQLGYDSYADATVPVAVDTSGVLSGQTLLALGGGVGAAHSIVLLNAAADPLTALERWRDLHFASPFNSGLAADAADPDGDGRPNLLEYALNTGPLVSNTGPAVTQELSGTGTSRKLEFSFQRIADPLLVYTVEASDTLASGSWVGLWSSTGSSNTAGVMNLTLSNPMATNPRHFLRLKVGH